MIQGMASVRSRTTGHPSVGTDRLPLTIGSVGPNVHQVQRDLQARGVSITADGAYGTATAAAVKAFQKNHNLAITGVVNQATWDKMFPTLKAGSTQKDAVKALQSVLRHWGYSSVTVNGKFDSATTHAVNDFKSHHGLTADGTVGPTTWKALFA